MKIISIDFSKKCTGIFTRIDGVEDSVIITNGKRVTMEETLKNIYTTIYRFLSVDKYDICLTEKYMAKGKMACAIIPMLEIQGVIHLAAAQTRTPIIFIPIATWKSLTIGSKINKNKEPGKYLARVEENYGRKFRTLDEADAFLIYQGAKVLVNYQGQSAAALKLKEKIKKAIKITK